MLPSGNDPRLIGPAAWYVDGDRQTGTRKTSGSAAQEKRRPAIRLKDKVVRGKPGDTLNSIINRIPDGANVFPYDVGFMDDDGNFQPSDGETTSESLIRKVLEATSQMRNRMGGTKVDLEKKIAKTGGSGAVLRPDPNFQVPEPPKGFPAKTVLGTGGETKFQVLHPDQIRVARGK